MAEGNGPATMSYEAPPPWPPPGMPLTPFGGGAPQPQPPRRRRWGRMVILLATVLSAVLIGVGLSNALARPPVGPAANGRNTSSLRGDALGSGAGLDVSAVTAAVNPGLVDVNSTLGYQQARGAGTGIVLEGSGVILTNNHVIRGATSLSVTDIGNGQSYPATVLGYDLTHDIAILQAQGASGLATAPLGDSDSVAVGDAVLGIGNAGGTGGTPSTAPGSVTALHRTITVSDDNGGSQQLNGLIQVAANVQPGDSGGPLANASGEVIGMDTAASESTATTPNRSPRTGSETGSGTPAGPAEGYAIPINDALEIAQQISSGSASDTVHIGPTAFLGIGVQDAAPTGLSRARGHTTGQTGAAVRTVAAGSPAQHAGLTTGDIIIAIEGDHVDSSDTLTALLSTHHPGDTIELTWTNTTGTQQTGSAQLIAGPPA